MKYGTWTLGQTEALLNRLGEDNARRLLDCPKVDVIFDADGQAKVTAKAPRRDVDRALHPPCYNNE